MAVVTAFSGIGSYILYPAADGRHNSQNRGCAHPRGTCRAERRKGRGAGNAEQRSAEDEDSHAEARARAYAQDLGASQRIAEQRLHLQAAHSEGRTREDRHDGLHQAYVEDDFARYGVAVASRQGCPHIADGDGPCFLTN